MVRTKLVALTAAAAALMAGPLGAAPAHAQNCDKINEPYNYPCEVAREGVAFVNDQAAGIIVFVGELRYELGELAVQVVCTVFPEQPACW